ncbi:MAG TPA: hypothetical protein VNC60_05745 [Actinomycetota bacterium]|nr:hypothetical protein [Actinomycetota bacterium]
MKLLRRLLKIQAGLWVLWSLAVGLVPRWVLERAFGQPALGDHVWVRAAAVMGFVLALLMVLVAQRIHDLWWWSWAFALLGAGTATVFALNALFDVPEGAPAWPFWVLAAVNGGFGAGLLVGMGIAGQEKPLV